MTLDAKIALDARGVPYETKEIVTTPQAIAWAEAEVARQVAEAKLEGATLEPLEKLFHLALVEYTEKHQPKSGDHARR